MNGRLGVRRWAHWTLRSRLVLVIGALTTVALLGANTAGFFLLHGYLLERIDDQLAAQARPLHAVRGPGTASRTGDSTAPGVGPSASPAPWAEPEPTSGAVRGLPGRFARLGQDQLVLVYRPDGTRDAERSSTPATGSPDPGTLAEVRARAATGRPYTAAAGAGGDDWRLLAVPVGQEGAVVVLGVSLSEVDRTAERLLLIDGAVTATVLLGLGLLAASVVRLGLRPLTTMEGIVAGITGGEPTRRVDGADPHTEPGRLGAAVNLMLDRIGAEMAARAASERRLRQFVADASHELRTPLTSIRGFAELYRRGGAPPGPPLDEVMGRIEGEAARMGVLVEDLLLLARLDQQRIPVWSPVDLLEVAADTIRDAHARTPRRRVRLTTLADRDDSFEPPSVLGDEHRLRQVAANLVGNALQHTGPEVRVTVRVGRLPAPPADPVVRSAPPPAPDGGLAVLEVHDGGPGIPVAHAGRVFERLYRVDPSRGRGNGGGSGLGLSIAASIVHAHGGCIELDTAPGAGTTFRVLLPTAPDDAAGHPTAGVHAACGAPADQPALRTAIPSQL
ncbi:HAMP domain-containing sensor histidine kinase [Micromonospora sp. WMMD1128]|uniref:sensor histidine kinase n=1 Tax=Micromonospora sp. WMMD1128 TaxID=3015150 RepID=UPI00248C0CB8|nr:HAMP domain-containing sensor histidine kinase [Micromonospora sp. WMMD1128]WBB73903.1 HAMP domain-containing sensor histidine kinase [Micromonospora sp. WMMD1128]